MIHVVNDYTPDDPSTRRRMDLARRSWQRLYESGEWTPLMLGSFERSSADLGDSRAVPYVRDLFDAALERSDRCVMTNADVGVIDDVQRYIGTALDAVGCLYSKRADFGRLDAIPLASDVVNSPSHCGGDLFAMTRSWWSVHRRMYPDLLTATEGWDFCMKIIMLDSGFTPGGVLCWHERHRSHWYANLTRCPAQRYNRNVARQWAMENGLSAYIRPTGCLFAEI